MNIQNNLYVNFTSKINSEKSLATKPLTLVPQKSDIFELSSKTNVTSKQDEKFLGSISNIFNNIFNKGFDKESKKIVKQDKLDLDKFKTLVSDMRINENDKALLRRSPFELNSYFGDKNYYTLYVAHDKEKSNLKLLDRNLNVLVQESETIKYSNDEPVSKTVMTNDFRTNTFTESKFKFDERGYEIMTESVKIKRDKQNRLIRKEIYQKSDLPGVYNVKYEFPNGKTKQVSKATVDKKTGHVLIEKDMRSSDMTRTQFRYEDDPKGNRIIDYKITSPDGEVLMEQSQSFEVLGRNKFRSSRNNKSYLIEHDSRNKVLKVTDEQEEMMSKIPLGGFYIIPENDYYNEYKLQKSEQKIANMLKKIPGDELFNLAETTSQIKDIDDKLASYCDTRIENEDGKYVSLAKIATSDDPYIFLHELGHATDRGGRPVFITMNSNGKPEPKFYDSIRDDDDFNYLYHQERENFLKEFPVTERYYIDYFINNTPQNDRKNVGLSETVAETNALLNTYPTEEVSGLRTQYLQQHFPKTIAYLSQRLTKTD